jgi:hypothetical protein
LTAFEISIQSRDAAKLRFSDQTYGTFLFSSAFYVTWRVPLNAEGSIMERERRILISAVVAAVILAPGLAAAAPPVDSTQIAPKTQQTDPKACANGSATVGQGGGGVDVRTQPGANLSDKLAQSNGVICPPAGVDPEIHEPTPPGGSMKVIPPPGTPGGNPSVQPK